MLSIYLSMADNDNDKEKIEKLYIEYKQLMYKKAFSILKNEHDAQDVVHEAFVKIINNLYKIHFVEDVKTLSFVMIITENTAKNILKRKNKYEPLNIDDFAEILPEVKPSKYNDTDLIAIKTALHKLSDQYYHILCLVDYLGYHIREAADLLGVNESNAGKRLHRARAKVAEYLKEEGLCNV